MCRDDWARESERSETAQEDDAQGSSCRIDRSKRLVRSSQGEPGHLKTEYCETKYFDSSQLLHRETLARCRRRDRERAGLACDEEKKQQGETASGRQEGVSTRSNRMASAHEALRVEHNQKDCAACSRQAERKCISIRPLSPARTNELGHTE